MCAEGQRAWGRVEIVDWDGPVLRSFGLEECAGAPHDARIVRRSALVRPVLRSCGLEECQWHNLVC